MLKRPCARSSGKVDGPTQTLGSFGGGDILEPTPKGTAINLFIEQFYHVPPKNNAVPLSYR